MHEGVKLTVEKTLRKITGKRPLIRFFSFLVGTASDALVRHRGMSFSTKDRDNDKWKSSNCALRFKGAWWYSSCHDSNLNGLYLNGKDDCQGMRWNSWPKRTDCYSVKKTEMKIRPKGF